MSDKDKEREAKEKAYKENIGKLDEKALKILKDAEEGGKR